MDLEDVRLSVYRVFAEDGRPPGIDQLAEEFRVDLDERDSVVMTHPFSTVPLGFAVMDTRTLWWGGCAWDSFALTHLLPAEGALLVTTRCPGCSRPHVWDVGRDAPPAGDQVAHFLVPVARMWDDVVFTCGHQRIFCSTGCVGAWLTATGSCRGYVMDLGTLWRLAAHWYDGRLDRGYVRREPAAAADYLRGVGLAGPGGCTCEAGGG